MSDGLDRHLRSKCAVAVMAKASIAGNTAFLRDAADNILSAAAFAGIRGWMAFTRGHLAVLVESPGLQECILDRCPARRVS
jgi:hypothetical protein